MYKKLKILLSYKSCSAGRKLSLFACHFKPSYFPLGDFVRATRSENKYRQRDWLKFAGEKNCREQVGTVSTFLCVCANNSPSGK